MASNAILGKISAILGVALGHPIPAEAIPVWRVALEPIPDYLAEQAALEVIRETKQCFAVAPGAVYSKALEIIKGNLPTGGEAWEMVRSVLRGEKRRSDLPEGVASAAEEIGWRTLDNMMVGDVATRAHFLRFYEEQSGKEAQRLMNALADTQREALDAQRDKQVLEVQHVA